MYGKDLNPEDYGFKDLESLLFSSIMQGEGGLICKNGRYFAAGDKNTREMLNLVRNTRSRNAKPRRTRDVIPATFGRDVTFLFFFSFFIYSLILIFSFKS